MCGLAFAIVLQTLLPIAVHGEPAAKVFYLKERVSVETDSGLMSVLPGTKVTQVSESKSGVKVKTAQGAVFVVRSTQLTADSDEGNRLAQTDAATQAALRSQMSDAAKKAEAEQTPTPRNIVIGGAAPSSPAVGSASLSPLSSLGTDPSLYSSQPTDTKVNAPKRTTTTVSPRRR